MYQTQTTTRMTHPLINLQSTDTIKCKNCSQQVPYQQVEQHMLTHLSLKYCANRGASIVIQNCKPVAKIDIRGLLEERCDENINVMSVLPNEMPTIQHYRKQVFAQPTAIHPLTHDQLNEDNETQQGNTSPNKVKAFQVSLPPKTDNNSGKQLVSQLQFDQQYPETMPQALQIRQKVSYNSNNFEIQYKNINYYMSQNYNGQGFNDGIIHEAKKRQMDEIITDGQPYLVYSCPKQKQNKNNERFTVQIRTNAKKPVYKQKISTISTTGSGFFKNTNGRSSSSSGFGLNLPKFSSSPQQIDNIMPITQQHNKFECSECRGFYCKQCGSDIPPIFRPPLAQTNHNLSYNHNDTSFQGSEQARSFYTSHVYNRERNAQGGKTSRVTRCTNCQ